VMGEHCWPSAGTEARGSYQSTRGPVDQTRCVDGYTKSLQEPSSSPRLLERIKTWRDTLDPPQHQQSASDLCVVVCVVIRNRPCHHYWHGTLRVKRNITNLPDMA
jgi:hypothetical protein